MPNHCHNDLYIEGPQEKVDALLTFIGANKDEPCFDFNQVIPYPEPFASRDKAFSELSHEKIIEQFGENASDGYNSGGYEWRIANWGTKWNAYELERRDYGKVCLTFQTAWSPPSPIIEALGKKFPELTLTLEYFERGAAYCGGFTILSKDAWYEDEEWQPGMISDKWTSGYKGCRGG